jgi:tetratricopeptide (TPR) repeat protein
MLQDEVTRDIAEHVAATLRPNAAKNSREEQSANLAGYEDYLRGRYYLARRTSDTLRKAAEYFQKAINADPNYAPAYVGLADTYNVISFYGGPPPSESFPKAEAAAKRALALDDKLGEAHAALGDTLFSYYWDWKGADREFRRAINLNPGSAVTHHWYSELLSMLGRHTEAISEIQKAAQLDPLSLVINGTVGGAYYLARRYTEAEKQVRQTLELDERFGPAHDLLGWVYLEQNRKREAIAEFKMAVALSGNSPYEEAALGCAYGRVGDYRRAREIAADLEFRSKQQYVSPEALARVYVALGENNLAIDRLETAYKTHVDTLNNIYVEPCYDVIRSDPRFQNLIRRMHFVS